MREIDSCTAEILRFLLQISVPMSSKKISQSIGISTRAVHYRLNRIRGVLEENNITLHIKPNFGILLVTTEDKKKRLLEKINEVTFFPKEKRIYIILFTLLSSSQPFNLRYFEELLSVSRSTVVKEITLAKKWFSKFNVILNSKPNFGYWVEGQENALRESFFNCILFGSYEFKQQNGLMEYCFLGRVKNNSSNTFMRMVENYFSEVDFYHLNSLISTLFDVQLTDQSNYCLILRLAILIKRCKKGKTIRNICSELGDFIQKNEYYWAEFLSTRISKFYNFSLGLEEISFITKYLFDAQIKRPVVDDPIDMDMVDYLLENDLINSVGLLLIQISTRLHPSLMFDIDLKNNLVLHMKYILDRTEYFFPEDNPIIQEIKEEYSRIYYIVEDCIRESKISYLIKYPDEIGYITIHIATALKKLQYKGRNKKTILLVCNSGIASALLLKSKIESEFSDIIIADVISYKELLKRKKFKGIDFIISTIPVYLIHSPPVLVVDVLLREVDIDNLKKVFTAESSHKSRLPGISIFEGPKLSDLFDIDLIELKKDAKSWKDAVNQAGQLLLYNKLIEERYIKAMEKVISEFGPFVVAWPGVALLHAGFSAGAKQLGMCLITLAEPVEFGHIENDPVDIVFALSIPMDKTIPLALDQLNNMLSCEKAIKIIRTASQKKILLNQITKFSSQDSSKNN